LFGVTAIRERKRIDLVVELSLWREEATYDRIGLEDRHREVLGISIREVALPVRPGRDMSSIIEIAARDELLRQAGHHSARDFVQQLESGLLTPPESVRPSARSVLPRRFGPNESSAPPPVMAREQRRR